MQRRFSGERRPFPLRLAGAGRRWLWPAGFVGLFTLVMVGSLLPWTKPYPPADFMGRTSVEQEASLPANRPDISEEELLTALTRYGSRPEGFSPADFPDVEVLLATPLYFSLTGRQLPELTSQQPFLVFYVSENVRTGQLPALPPRPILQVGRVYHQPAEVRILSDSPQQRTTLVRYKGAWSDGSTIIPPEGPSFEMFFPAASGVEAGSVLSWELPIFYGTDYSNGEVFLNTATLRTTAC